MPAAIRCLLLLSFAACLPAHALDAEAAPSANFALGHWKLTLPVDGMGGKHGVAAEIPPSMLAAGYRSTWFHTALDGGLEFRAPVDGATTAGSDYPRSELREMLNPDDDNQNWSAAGKAELAANCAILRVPSSTGKLVIGQIHAFDGPPLLKLRYQYQGAGKGGRLDALVNTHPTDAGSTAYALAEGIALREAFDYRIAVEGGVMTLQAAGGETVRLPIAGDWSAYRFYFKAGVYVQASGNSSLDGAVARFYRLAVAH
ncbi:polysaccharide lyase family 7 protein [Solimonas soli]|uniref:polysaccharide lyase family 7 protein n=1 Tax=Solimonas soli TaxID=413479 RepID=UPI0004B93058|nr:polysaccharide lyase family 7 protein [Solimonas soli]